MRNAFARLQLRQSGMNMAVLPALRSQIGGQNLGSQIFHGLLSRFGQRRQSRLRFGIEMNDNRCVSHSFSTFIISRFQKKLPEI